MASKQKKTQKQCWIVARYVFKTNGTVCSVVRTSKGKEHKVWTHSNGLNPHCECDGFEKSHGKLLCYHLKTVLGIVEEARSASPVAKVIPLRSKQPVDSTNNRRKVRVQSQAERKQRVS
jgi:hypothetical protein